MVIMTVKKNCKKNFLGGKLGVNAGGKGVIAPIYLFIGLLVPPYNSFHLGTFLPPPPPMKVALVCLVPENIL